MASVNDFFSVQQRQGTVGNPASLVPSRQAQPNYYYPGTKYDVGLDTVWARSYAGNATQSNTSNTYFDYFYSSQDIIVTVDYTEDDANFRILPMISFGFNIQQQKAPLYGFWSYTYDAVMRGTRLVQGSMTLATRYPNYMSDLVAKAAAGRQQASVPNYQYSKPLTEDDTNIEHYWGKNMDPALASSGRSLYSVHPPFSFVILYGVQNVSINGLDGQFDQFAADNAWMVDTNDRLVPADSVHNQDKIIIDAVELQSMSTEFSADGQVVAETYQWFGRDIILP